jgi:hypothetical protein
VAVALALFVYAPILGYFTAFHGDWSYLYLVPWHSVPSAVDLVLVFAASATIPLGFAVSRAQALSGQRAWLMRFAAAPTAVVLLMLALSARRLAVSATYAQYHGAFGVSSITTSSLGRGILLAAITLVAAIAWSIRQVR